MCKKMDKNWGKWDKDFKIKIGATLKSIVIEQDDNNWRFRWKYVNIKCISDIEWKSLDMDWMLSWSKVSCQ